MANLHLREAYLVALLDMLDDDFDGIDGYLESIGIRQADLVSFRRVFVVA